jgi:hypothetical protein
LPLPSGARGFNVVMAEKVRFSELSETDGVAAEELELLPLLALVEAELLQAAAARHTASDTDATAAPFLATRIIKTTSCLKRKGRRVRIQACSIPRRPGGASRP